MSVLTSKITSKGQVTIPRNIRNFLKSNTVEFKMLNGNVVIVPVKNIGGSLSKYAKEYISLEDIKEKVWEAVINDKIRKKTA